MILIAVRLILFLVMSITYWMLLICSDEVYYGKPLSASFFGSVMFVIGGISSIGYLTTYILAMGFWWGMLIGLGSLNLIILIIRYTPILDYLKKLVGD